MRLLSLTLGNFKGVRDFTLEPGGLSTNVYGTNATGKTTLADALSWLLFDKDSTGAKDFGIKTLEDGEPLHGVEHAAEATLEVETDGPPTEITLRKVYHEVWTMARGSAKKTFTGHTTDYFIDGVPVPLKDYKAQIASIADEGIFRLLTDPMAYNALHWQDRRRVLLEVCGDVDDADVIATDKQLGRLPEILGSRSLDEHRKVMAARRKKINDELEDIPVRIAEVERGLPDPVKANPDKLANLDAEITRYREQIAEAKAGGQTAELTKRKRELEGEILALDNEVTQARNAKRAKADEAASERRSALSAAKDEEAALVADIARMERSIASVDELLTQMTARMDLLRENWTEINGEEFPGAELAEVCPTCEQPLPPERIEAAREKALATWNREKAERLEKINAEGKQLKTDSVEGAAAIAHDRADIDALRTERVKAGEKVYEAELRLDSIEPAKLDLEDESPLKAAKVAELAKLEDEITTAAMSAEPKLAELNDSIAMAEAEKAALEATNRDAEAREKGKGRIAELAAQEKDLAAEYEQLEADLFLTEEFVRAKVALLEDKINARFEVARFRLFEQQVNGGINEVCECLVDGVPYSAGLNNAARIAVGLDIIRTLSGHYGVTAPVFLDNAEAITDIPDIGAQVIALYVSEADKELRVQTREG